MRVNVEAVPVDGSRTPMYPVTEFTDLNHGGVRILAANAANAAVDLEILPMRNPRRIQRISYRITDNWVPADLRTGSFNIQVSAPRPGGTRSPATGAAGYGQPGYRQPGNHGDENQRPGGWSGDRASEPHPRCSTRAS